jgi:hypothetical protein
VSSLVKAKVLLRIHLLLLLLLLLHVSLLLELRLRLLVLVKSLHLLHSLPTKLIYLSISHILSLEPTIALRVHLVILIHLRLHLLLLGHHGLEPTWVWILGLDGRFH